MARMSNEKPKVSICIPTYQQTSYLQKTLKSILDQNFFDFEIIVTDDSENDEVERIIDRFAPSNRIFYHRNRRRLGSPENWNRAISHASGEYIKILHHDDFFTRPDSLRRYVEALDKCSGIGFCFSATKVVDSLGKFVRVHSVTDQQLSRLREQPSSLFLANLVGAPSATIFRSSLTEVFDSRMKWLVDVDFYIRLLEKNKLAYIPEALIATFSGASHQVTNECFNTEIEVFEYFYLYDKIQPPDTEPFIQHMKSVLERNRIVSIRHPFFRRRQILIPEDILEWLKPNAKRFFRRKSAAFVNKLLGLFGRLRNFFRMNPKIEG